MNNIKELTDKILTNINSYNKQNQKNQKKIKKLFLYILKNIIYRCAHFCNFSNRKLINNQDLISTLKLEFYNKKYSSKITNKKNNKTNNVNNNNLKNLLYNFIPNYFIISSEVVEKISDISIIIINDILKDTKSFKVKIQNLEDYKYFFSSFYKEI